ncbi:hypothetical protein F7725_007680 [Dissostichus mawsoni]|uniref:SNRNP25 ubiquitin-like domain-containing protein n=1 Tax=Dissostichus mawsoni TaxID=36200 RepID=A0A7J5Y7A3_DISMA|nr:hypothetical protein F7725_007680 [Dissostichus mawsoni]
MAAGARTEAGTMAGWAGSGAGTMALGPKLGPEPWLLGPELGPEPWLLGPEQRPGSWLCGPVNLEEVNSQIALEYGQAMTVRVLKADGEIMPIVVVQNATVLDLKKAIRRFMG